jgi:type IX secretion system PorP/SprF family membrane protein
MNMNRCLIFVLIGGLLAGHRATAQSDYDLSQRWFNESIYNPGAVGNHLTTGVFVHARTQWFGTEGTPATQVVTFDTYVQELRSAFGLVVLHDQIGYLNTYNIKLSYAYHIPIGYNSSLALGLSGGWLNRNRNLEGNMADDPNDPLLAQNRVANHDPEFDFGLEYNGAFKLGASVRHLGFYSHSDFAAPPLTIWTYASTRFKVTGGWSIEPGMSYNYRSGIHYLEAGAMLYFAQRYEHTLFYRDRFWMGATYRMHQQFAVLLGMHITPKIRIGYSFDYGVGDQAILSNKGMHELFFAWHFNRIFRKDVCCPALAR